MVAIGAGYGEKLVVAGQATSVAPNAGKALEGPNGQGSSSHSLSFDHLRSIRASFIAIVKALRYPTSMTCLRAREVPV